MDRSITLDGTVKPSAVTNMKKLTSNNQHTASVVCVLGCVAFLSACAGEPGAKDSNQPDGSSSNGVTTDTATTGETSTATTSGETSGVTEPPPPYAPPEGMLKRLTRPQFANAVRDIFGYEVDVSKIDADIHNGDFAAVGAASVVTSARGVEQYGTMIEQAVDNIFSDPAKVATFVGCTPVEVTDACVRTFLETVGKRSWRRPLETAEVDQLVGVAQTAATELASALAGIRWATVAMFTSVHFLYRPELGAPAGDGTNQLTNYELASRLAFLTWNTLPDQQLLQDAESGVLGTPEGLLAVTERMLQAPVGRESVGAFAEDYMRLDRILTQAKDQEMYEEYTPALQKGMVQDMRRVWEIIAFDEDTSALNLFSTNKVVANAELAGLYGLDQSGLSSDTFKEFSLPADGPRIGILAKAGFLSQFANQKEGSPTLRGKFMSEVLMCKPINPPPAGVALELPPSDSDMPTTKRQRLEQHRADAVCASCHAKMDPLGLPFENFDAIGKYRTLDSGLPVDATGEFDGTPVANSTELGQAMSASPLIASCLVRKYYSYAMGHEERDVDATVINELDASFEGAGYRLKQLIIDLATSDAFTQVAPQTH